jgi:diguanylate cyclase (GGDEF)-like protein/PAS domain S-box-containing protein
MGSGREAGGRSDIRMLIDHLPIGVYRSAPDGTILEANSALARLLGVARPEELKQRNALEFYASSRDRDEQFARLAQKPEDFTELEMRSADSRTVWVRDFSRAIYGPGGSIAYIEGALIDITELRRAEYELSRSEREYRSLFELARDAIIIFAIEDEAILDVNDSACRLYGFDRDEFLSMSLESITKNVAMGKERIARLIEGGEGRTFETSHFRKDGQELRLEINAANVVFKGRKAIMSVNRDLSDRKRRLDDLRRLAFSDPLTGIANRALFDDHLYLALAQAEHSGAPLALMFLDLDGFKDVNDAYGHAAGDEVLRAIAHRLAATLRRSDTLARFGGDEFIALLPILNSPGDIELVAPKLLAVAREPVAIEGTLVSVSASLGVALYPGCGTTAEELLVAADRAMYEAKCAGKDTYRLAETRNLDKL